MPADSPKRPLPPPLVIPPPGLWRDTPPVLFGPILGLLGLGLLIRALSRALDLPVMGDLAQMLLGAMVLLHAFAVLAYVSKLRYRPSVLLEDVAVLPGRTGIAAGLAGLHLSGAALVPMVPWLALAMTLSGLALQAVYMAVVIRVMATGPAELRAISPTMNLIFTGHIMSSFALVPLGWTALAEGVFWLGLATALPIWVLSLLRAPSTPAPLRPLLVINLGPASVLASDAAGLGWVWLALGLALWSLLLAGWVAVRVNWVLESGFSPFWGSLTFPIAAFGQAMLRGLGVPGLWLAVAVGLVAVVAIPWIAVQVLRLWPGGRLARMTNAAIA